MADRTKSYKTLILNTLTFAIGSFGSKLLVIILVPLYTSALSPDQFGIVDLIAQTANILIPIFTLTISEAALRFGMDAKDDFEKKKVYTVSLTVAFAGLALMAVIFPVLSKLSYLKGFSLILYIYVWTSSLRQINMFFTRAMKKVKLFAVDGVICTLTMLIFNIVFLLKFKWGIIGYLLAIILSDLISSLFLFTGGRLWRYISLRAIDLSFAKSMVKYSAPLMSATLLSLVTSISDRFVIRYFHGDYMAGINAIAYKIPTILTTVFTMFSQAWNMSAIAENNSSERESFYTNVFRINQSFMYIMSAGILLLIKPITYLWIDKDYFESYRYSPILTLATVFTCFCVFLGSVYIAQKKTKQSFYTSLAAGIINIILNFALIPKFGIYGAAIATFAAYFVLFIYRLIDSRRYISFDYSKSKIAVNTVLLAAMAVINQFDFLRPWIMYSLLAVIFIAIAAVNFKDVLRILLFIVPNKLKSKLSFIKKLENKIN